MPGYRREDLPHLTHVLSPFYLDFDARGLDAGLSLDDALCEERENGDLAAVAADVDRLLAVAPDERSAAAALAPWLGRRGPPDGDGYRQYLLMVRDRVAEARRDPGSLAPFDAGEWVRPVRRPRFADPATSERAIADVLRANEWAYRRWLRDPAGLARQHYVADVGYPVGSVVDLTTEAELVASSVAVVMRLERGGGEAVYDVWPEIELDPAVRRRFPRLCHLFGGWFGDVPEPPWPAQRDLLATADEPARSWLRAELDELLCRDDAELLAAVTALGSHVLPGRSMRRWVQRIRWRLDRPGPSGL